MATNSSAPYRDTIERMEEHEIIHRLTTGQFSDEAKPVAEAVLRNRGIDPSNPVVPEDQRPKPSPPKPWKPRLLPIIFGATAAAMAGRQIGAALGGAIGAGIVSALLLLLGWWVGARIATWVRSIQSKPLRFLVPVAAAVVWVMFLGFIGVLAQVGGGRYHP